MPLTSLKHPAQWPVPLRWGALIVGSGLLAAALSTAHLSAALLLGPMIVAIALAATGGAVAAPRVVFVMAQGVVQ